jgi:hemolysin D
MPIQKFNPSDRISLSTDTAVRTFESPTAEVIAKRDPWKERGVIYVLTALILFGVVFISLAKLDRIVVAQGRVVPIEGALTVQPLEKAIINRVLVSVGQVVKKGQVLATCDPTFVRADLTQLRQKVADLDAQRRRMEAEEAGRPFVPSLSQPYDVLQESIWKQRNTEYTSGVSDFDQRINSFEAQLAGIRQDIANYKSRLKIAKETEDMYIRLVAAGAATHLDLIEKQDARIEVERNMSMQENLLVSTEHSLESLKEQRTVYIKKWHDDNLNNLVQAKGNLAQAEDDHTKATRLDELVDLKSPMDAVVLKIPMLSTGGVAMDAEPLFSLMPLDAPIEVDAQIDSYESGFAKVGDPVVIKFDTYRFLEHGSADGVVKSISEDSFTEASGQDTVTAKGGQGDARNPYFDTRITIKAVHLHDVPPDTRIIPGMTLQADIVVGRRTIMWYLLGGALRSGAEAMREP